MTTRITGLATGLDIDSLVKTTMQAYQTKIDQQTQKKDVLEIQQKLYRDLVTKSQDFFNKYLDRSSKDCLRQSSSYTSVKFESSNSAVSVKGLAGAEAANYKVEVSQLAEVAKYTIKDSELSGVTGIRINGHQVNVSATDSSADIIEKINQKLKAENITNVKAKYSDISKGIVIESKDTGRSSEFTLGILKGSDSNTIPAENSVANGINGTSANTSYTIEQLRAMSTLTVGANKVDLTTINSNSELAGEGKEVDYLNAVKKAIDESKAQESSVNTDEKKLSLTVDGVTTNYNRDTLKTMDTIYIGDMAVDIRSINNNEDLTARGKENDYLNAVKKAIDEQSALPAYTGVDSDHKTLVLQAKQIGSGDQFKVNGTAISNGTDNQPAKIDFNVSDLTGMKTIVVNGIGVDLTGKTTADQIKDAINDTLSLEGNKQFCGGVQAEVTSDGKISLATAGKGVGNTLAVSGYDASNALIFPAAGTGEDITVQGKDSLAFITDAGGNVYTAVSGKNSVTVDNTQFTFLDTTRNDAGVLEAAKITGTNDASDLKDKLVKFIDDYNTLITDLNKAIQTKHDRNYSPLTADQKKEMTESQIKLWEDKVEEGQLYRDSDLTRITDSLKSTMRTVMSSSGLSLEKIGIKPVSDYSGTKNGTFSIVDEDALKEAIEENPEDVMNLFIGGSVTDVTAGDGNTGLLNQLYYTLNKEMFGSSSSLSKKVGFEGTSTFTNNTITNDISDYETKIKDMQKQYTTKEQALYSKYSTLETAMNKYNSQLSYLTSAFSS